MVFTSRMKTKTAVAEERKGLHKRDEDQNSRARGTKRSS